MRGILLTWNPERWPLDPQERTELEELSKSDFPSRWSTGNTENIPVGSPVFLLAQGKRPGLIASGITRTEVYKDKRWEGGKGLTE